MKDICERLREEKAADWKAACESARLASAEIARLRLTDAEREAVKYFAAFHQSPREADANAAATLRKMLERLTSNCPAKPDSWLGG